MSDIVAHAREYARNLGGPPEDYLVWQLADEIERLRALVKTLADDLEDELKGHYRGTLDYPSERRRFERDMANVYEARRALEGK
jgi:hypothetical protein